MRSYFASLWNKRIVSLTFLTFCLLIILASVNTTPAVSDMIVKGKNSLNIIKSKLGRTSKREAYVFFFHAEPPKKETHDEPNINDRDLFIKDNYFTNLRMAIYSLKYNNKTRDNNRDIVVITLDYVSKRKLDRLRRDGAIVKIVDIIKLPEIKKDAKYPNGVCNSRYDTVMTKLRIWQLVEYKRVLLMDADVLLTRPLNYLWDDPSTQFQAVNKVFENVTNLTATLKEDNLPFEEYVFAAETDSSPFYGIKTYFNCGFVMLNPSQAIFEYLIEFMQYPDEYHGFCMPEQNLFNQVFRRQGPLPWVQFPSNTHAVFISKSCADSGFSICHLKWWEYEKKEGTDFKFGLELRGEMNGYYEAMDARLVS